MLTAYIYGLIAALLWSFVNIFDKYLVEKYCKETGVGALIILSSLFPVVLLPVSFFLAKSSIVIDINSIMILLVSGVIGVLWLSLYLFALEEEEVSVVMPMFQLTPVFAFILGFILLGESLSTGQILFGAIIVLGSIVLSIERTSGTLKLKLIAYVAGSSALIALMNVLFKFAALDESFWVSVFWHSVGMLLSGVLLYSFNKKYRNDFHEFIRINVKTVIPINLTSETFTVIGDVLFAFAILLAPVAIIQTTEAFQPVFVFIIGIILTLTLPQIFQEDVTKYALMHKITGILIVLTGTIGLLNPF